MSQFVQLILLDQVQVTTTPAMNKALVLLASTLVLVSFMNLTCAMITETEDIAGKYIPVNRFGQPAKFGGKNQPRSITDALQSGVMSHPLQNTFEIDQHSAVWVSRHESINSDGDGAQYTSIVENGDHQGTNISSTVGFRGEVLRRDDRLIIASVAADMFTAGDGRKAIFEFFADTPAPYSCIRVMRRSYPPQSQAATALKSSFFINPSLYAQIPCSLKPNPIDEVKPIAVDLDPLTNDSKAIEELVIAYRDSNKGIVIGAHKDSPLAFNGASSGNLSLFASPSPSVAAELAALNLPNRDSYDLTPCDFDGDGIFEVCLAYIKGSNLNVRVFGFTGFSRDSLVQKYSQSFGSAPVGGKVAVAAHFLGNKGNLQDDFVISVESIPSYFLYIVRMNGSDIIAKKFNSLSMGGSPNSYATKYNIHDLAIGDFDGDGQQEITVSHFGIGCYNCPEISVFHYNDTTGSLVKVHRQTYPSGTEEADYVMEIAVASLIKSSDDTSEQLIVMYNGLRLINMKPFLNFTDVTEVNNAFELKYFAQFSQPYFPQHTHLGVGKVIESNIRVGTPTYSVYNEVRQVLAVINSPPKHRDFLNGKFVEIGNNDGKTLARITRISQESEKLGVTQKRAWTVGASVEAKVGTALKTTLGATYGQNFEKTEGSLKTVFYQDVSEVSGDDLIIQLQLSWDVWEYPVFSTDDGSTVTTILVMFPRVSPTNPNEPDVLMAWVTARTQKEVRSFHEVDNLFSYPEGAPSDITSDSYSKQTRTVNGGASVGITVKLSDLTSAGLSTTSTLALDASLSATAGAKIPLIGDFGVTLTVKGSYSQEDFSTSEVSLLTSTQLDVQYGPGQASTLSYNVRPYIYFSRSGYLVLDYAVDFNGDSNTISQWQQLYNKPDLTWNLPFRWARNDITKEFDVNQWLTKDMFITPRRPTDGQNVTLTVRMRNYSLKPAEGNFTIQFYLGDFNNAANKFGETVVVNSLDARGDVSFNLTDTYRSDVFCLYGVIDSENAIDELHETNNIAYAVIGEPINTPLCGKPISDKFPDAFGGLSTTPQTGGPASQTPQIDSPVSRTPQTTNVTSDTVKMPPLGAALIVSLVIGFFF